MDNMAKLTEDHLISVYDIDGFVRICKKLSSSEVFDLIRELQVLAVKELASLEPQVFKNLGDGNLIVFSKKDIDRKVMGLHRLKSRIEDLLEQQGYSVKCSFALHYGEVTLGDIGMEPFSHRDAFGDAVNQTFLLNGKPYRGRFTISPQLFRKLDSATRKIFHKFTPPIVYTAE